MPGIAQIEFLPYGVGLHGLAPLSVADAFAVVEVDTFTHIAVQRDQRVDWVGPQGRKEVHRDALEKKKFIYEISLDEFPEREKKLHQ
jgi:hypothetical protein